MYRKIIIIIQKMRYKWVMHMVRLLKNNMLTLVFFTNATNSRFLIAKSDRNSSVFCKSFIKLTN